jgi:glycosyltransferase involved in cell wall biosynthesis
MSFAKAVCQQSYGHEIILVLNGLFKNTIEPIRAEFNKILNQSQILVWSAPGDVNESDFRNELKRQNAEIIREAFLASLKPDVIHVSSLFEGYVDNAVTSISRFDNRTPVSAMLYDLIPLNNQDHYLKPNPGYEKFYLSKLGLLKKANCLLAISEFTKKEAIELIDAEENKIFNISAATEPHFKRISIDPSAKNLLLNEFNIFGKFIIYTGGDDKRKNLERLISAYALLPTEIRDEYQLVMAGKMHPAETERLNRHAFKNGLHSDQLIYTGYISDDTLVQLMNLCELFVFPSWQEGFGLPALEAMSCGSVVITAKTSSLPEVMALDEAMFDPYCAISMRDKIHQGLTDEGFRQRNTKHGLDRAQQFNWKRVAENAIMAWSKIVQKFNPLMPRVGSIKPKLAFISPLPPERTGIADYSSELLLYLSAHYQIELIVEQEQVDIDKLGIEFTCHDSEWFKMNHEIFDRVIYHFGNSPFHCHMLSLMEDFPGVVVLHDFYLSGLMSWLEIDGGRNLTWSSVLLKEHGYVALKNRIEDPEFAKLNYPVNGQVLHHAKGVIVHSEHAKDLITSWQGKEIAKKVDVLPLLRIPPGLSQYQNSRMRQGLAEDDFVVCSFGFMDHSKLNHKLIKAWQNSALVQDSRCKLVFVGQNAGGEYGSFIQKMINQSKHPEQIHITGFSTSEKYRDYLGLADVAVQLRTTSRGETSAAALDVLNYGIATIINAHGSMAEIKAESAWVLPDDFDENQLTLALEKLWMDSQFRKNLGIAGQLFCQKQHAPVSCAQLYANAIEKSYLGRSVDFSTMTDKLADLLSKPTNEELLPAVADSLAVNFPENKIHKRIYLDITETKNTDRKTGIERVTRAILLELLKNTPSGYLIEPVYLSCIDSHPHYRHAIKYTLELLGTNYNGLKEDPIEVQNGDIVVVLDLSGDALVKAQQSGLHERMRELGVEVHAVVYDLLPVTMPEVFPPGAAEAHENWLKAISSFDGAVTISKAVASDLQKWQSEQNFVEQIRRPFRINWFHLGADFESSPATQGIPSSAQRVLDNIQKRPSFLMVGTIEPRKGYIQVIEAFSQLWQEGIDVNLIVTGREGWVDLGTAQRRDIPQVVEKLRHHPEVGNRLHWLDSVSDQYLEKIYESCTCLIAASWGEGFGLPLIEGARYKIPILARDIKVFREVAGPHASYFNASKPQDLAQSIKEWLNDWPSQTVKSEDMPYLTWTQSVQQLSGALIPMRKPDETIPV